MGGFNVEHPDSISFEQGDVLRDAGILFLDIEVIKFTQMIIPDEQVEGESVWGFIAKQVDNGIRHFENEWHSLDAFLATYPTPDSLVEYVLSLEDFDLIPRSLLRVSITHPMMDDVECAY